MSAHAARQPRLRAFVAVVGAGRRRLDLLAQRTDYACCSPTWIPEAASDVVTQAQDARRSTYQLDDGGRGDSRAGRACRRAAAGVRSRRHCRRRAASASRSSTAPRSARPSSSNRSTTAARSKARWRGRLARSARSPARACTSRWRRLAVRVEGAAGQGIGRPEAARQPPAGGRHGAGHRQPGRRRASKGCGPKRWSILDSFGRPLAKPAEAATTAGRRRADGTAAAASSATCSTSVASLLEPVVGADRVRVNVVGAPRRADRGGAPRRNGTRTARSCAASRRPVTLPAAVRARRASPDARGNLPGQVPVAAAAAAASTEPGDAPGNTGAPGRPSAAAGRGAGAVARFETTNYEISKVVRHTIRPRGEIARLSVAVILDNESVADEETRTAARPDTTPRPHAEDCRRFSRIVAAAVGLDPARGDQLTVENIPFEEIPVESRCRRRRCGSASAPQAYEGWPPASASSRSARSRVFAFVRPLMRRRHCHCGAGRVAGAARAPARTVRDLEGEIDAQLDAAADEQSAERMKLPVLTRRIAQLTAKEPEHAARLMRMWMSRRSADMTTTGSPVPLTGVTQGRHPDTAARRGDASARSSSISTRTRSSRSPAKWR